MSCGKNIEKQTNVILPYNISQPGDLNKDSPVWYDMSIMVDENVILFLGYRLSIKKEKKEQQGNLCSCSSLSPKGA